MARGHRLVAPIVHYNVAPLEERTMRALISDCTPTASIVVVGQICIAAGVVHRAFGRGAAFLLFVFATDFVLPTFARTRAALLAAARLSGDHGVYRNSG
jgi:hypothetical protein